MRRDSMGEPVVASIRTLSRSSGHLSRPLLKSDDRDADTSRMPTALTPRHSKDATSRTHHPPHRSNDSDGQEPDRPITAAQLLAGRLPAKLIIHACALDDTLANQLLQLARLGIAALGGLHDVPTPIQRRNAEITKLTPRQTEVLQLSEQGHTANRSLPRSASRKRRSPPTEATPTNASASATLPAQPTDSEAPEAELRRIRTADPKSGSCRSTNRTQRVSGETVCSCLSRATEAT